MCIVRRENFIDVWIDFRICCKKEIVVDDWLLGTRAILLIHVLSFIRGQY